MQVRTRWLLAEANGRADVAAVQSVAVDHPAGKQARMRKRFRQRVDATVADVKRRKISVPIGQWLFAKLGSENRITGCWCGPGPRRHNSARSGRPKAPSRLWMNPASCPAKTR